MLTTVRLMSALQASLLGTRPSFLCTPRYSPGHSVGIICVLVHLPHGAGSSVFPESSNTEMVTGH